MANEVRRVDAWMPLWIGDYLADTMTLTTVMHGAYLLLLFAYWRNRGPLPDDDEDLAAIVKASRQEWKRLRPKLLRFFKLEDGHWTHGRADAELANAGIRKTKAVSKARAAAQARWEKAAASSKKQGDETPSGSASSDAPSMLEASRGAVHGSVLEDCPSPSPSPCSTGELGERDSRTVPAGGYRRGDEPPDVDPPPGFLDPDPAEPSVPPPRAVTPAGAVGKAMRDAKFPPDRIQLAHPKLATLTAAGATPELFGEVAAEAVRVGKVNMGWVLATIEGRMRDAAAVAPPGRREAAGKPPGAKAAGAVISGDVASLQALYDPHADLPDDADVPPLTAVQWMAHIEARKRASAAASPAEGT